MVPFAELVWRLVASVLGASVLGTSVLGTVAGASHPASVIALVGAAGAIGLFAIAAASVVRSALAAAASRSCGDGLETLLEPADRGELLSQSDPDAEGRPRPRAPGFTLQTA